jgi:hypothetical protein
MGDAGSALFIFAGMGGTGGGAGREAKEKLFVCDREYEAPGAVL